MKLNYLKVEGRILRTVGIPVLVYHGIAAEANSVLAEYAVSPEAFAEQMSYLAAKGYSSVSALDVLNHVVLGAPLPRKPVAITFDDGFLDNYSNALPVLVRHNFTATVFVVAERVGQSAEWDRRRDEPSHPLMSWSQINEMIERGIVIGAHACTHPDLTRLSLTEAKREIERSREIIERNTNSEVQFFAYPHSRFNDAIRRMVAEAGYLGAFSTNWGITHPGNDVFAMNRMMVLRDHELGYFKWMMDLGIQHPWYYRMFKGKKTAVRNLLKSRLLAK